MKRFFEKLFGRQRDGNLTGYEIDRETNHLPSIVKPVRTRQTHPLLEMVRTSDRFFKRPNSYYFDVAVPFNFSPDAAARQAQHEAVTGQNLGPIRRPIAEERPENIKQLSAIYPEYGSVRDMAHRHFLMLFRLQYDRLHALFGASVPSAQFVMMYWKRRDASPTVVQEAINGVTLWDLVGHSLKTLKREYRQHACDIAQQLSVFVESQDGAQHIDFNFANFVFDLERRKLYYVESKPTLFRTERMNLHNRRLLIEWIVTPHQ